jgi:hypothetical protein
VGTVDESGEYLMGTRQLNSYAAKYSNGLDRPFQLAGAPTSGASGSYVGRAAVGSELIDNVAGKLYVATVATSSTVTWVLVGSQV